MKRLQKSAALFLPCLLFALQPSHLGATVIVADTFSGGAGSTLNGAAASTFNSAITTAGGSGTWVANENYRADGTLTSSTGFQSSSATLALGSYIWNTRGTENGSFTLTATFSAIGGGTTTYSSRWVSLGFFGSQPGLNEAFYYGNVNSTATAVHRQVDGTSNNYFPGPGTTGGSNGGDITGTVTFEITLDLRSHNGTTNFGSVTFKNSATNVSTTATLANDGGVNPFQYFGFSGNTDSSSVPGPTTTITNFSLSQIPEPASLILAPIGLATLLRRRRTA